MRRHWEDGTLLDEEVFEQREGDRNIKEGSGRCSGLTGRAGDVPGVGCAGGGGVQSILMLITVILKGDTSNNNISSSSSSSRNLCNKCMMAMFNSFHFLSS